MMSEGETDILELWLDGELTPFEQKEVQATLRLDPQASKRMTEIRTLRALRSEYFSTLEPREDPAEKLLAQAREREASEKGLTLRYRLYRYAATIAACIALGFLAGYMTRFAQQPKLAAGGSTAASALAYEVSITDDQGHVIAVQKFSDPAEALEFSEDVRRSQGRLERLETSTPTIRSAQF
jgi:anti-sigma factor RsiW